MIDRICLFFDNFEHWEEDDAQTGDFWSKVQRSFLPISARKSAQMFTKVWKECWWQLRIFKHKSYGKRALKPARGSGGRAL